MKNIRLSEYKVFAYRMALVYLFYSLSRLLFVYFNADLLQIDNLSELLNICFYGLRFDTTAILYINSLFILLSIIPIRKSTSQGYQKMSFYIYFITNSISIAFNYVDMIYYRFTFARSTTNITESLENEQNKITLLLNFLQNYWYIFLLFFASMALWIFLYKKVKIKPQSTIGNAAYYGYSALFFVGIVILTITGIRGGDLKKSTRPIGVVDANNYVTKINQANAILNTPFCMLRSINKKGFKKVHFVSDDTIEKLIVPTKQYPSDGFQKKNVVIFIMESFGREYIGAFNQNTNIDGYQSFTPFLDSLAQHSLIFDNAYANGSKSIHAMPSVLAGIPSFKEAFTSSSYASTDMESLVSIFNKEGYNTSFFHGAPNGSMGFLGFSNILGYNNYFGKNQYNNDKDFDGVWGIWDEKFFQFMKTELDQQTEPFMATMFSVTSHEPFQIPSAFKNVFTDSLLPIHKCIRYSDYALKEFFRTAQKQPWFNNTLFVITADHCNQVYYPEYQSALNRTAIPILFYSPSDPQLQGRDSHWAQHIDIYPTILDILGYNQPFRSWGRSLLNQEEVPPFAINYLNNQYQFMYGDYVCTFDGQKPTGYFHKTDTNYTNNLINTNNPEFVKIKTMCESFLQNYFDKIINKKL
ncbi:MAG: sulfatase-like hydrolase/transferase [Bacteroidota bacterium]|nr:sulfatase-like hydrolase/transferase [Bacteroidota bacterium]